jgi:hypothetical protein
MALPGTIFRLLAKGLRRFAGQVAVSVAATICATAIYGHIVSQRASAPGPQAVSSASPARIGGGAIEVQTLAYYPEHLAALDSLSRFRPVSPQRTAELAGGLSATRTVSVADAAKPRRIASADVLPPGRPASLVQVEVLPPRRPAGAPITIAAAPAEPAELRAKIWGVELPHFVPTGASVVDKLASMKDRIGGLIHVSSR